MTQRSYAALAAELITVADRLAELDAQGVRPVENASLYLSFGYSTVDGAKYVPEVDAVASALGLTAATKIEGRGTRRTAERVACNDYRSALHLNVRVSLPAPPTRAQKVADLQRENDELRAQLATQGGQA
jgi:hypothetical protein